MTNPLCIKRAHELADQDSTETAWLLENLWADQAVGIVGGEPKCCKSILSLSMAVSIATGTPCLSRYTPTQIGPVVLFAAEDSERIVKDRLMGLCRAIGQDLHALDIHVICEPILRIDHQSDQEKLVSAIQDIRPALLVLDPFVRLHRIDENQSSEVAPLLAFLRTLQRRFHCAVVLVHHARKGALHHRAGQALRGSSEFHAWGDSNLYLRRKSGNLFLSIEHRAAKGQDDLPLSLEADQHALALTIQTEKPTPTHAEPSLEQRILECLDEATAPLSIRELRAQCRVRMQSLCTLLAEMEQKDLIQKTSVGYSSIDCD